MTHYIPDSNISWTVEYKGIRLINRKTGKMFFLPYPEAALWDLLTGKLSMERIIAIMSSVSPVNKEHIEIWIKNTISGWKKGKWLK